MFSATVSNFNLNGWGAPPTSGSTGPLSAGTVVNDASIGTQAWSNPGNAIASDNVYTSVSIGPSTFSNWLKATNFGFSIPTNATVTGIVAEVEASMAFFVSGAGTNSIQLVKGGTIGGTDHGPGSIPATDTYLLFGTSSDLWGLSWTPADINNSTFGVAYSVFNPDALDGTSVNVDHIRITVYYTVPPSGIRLATTTSATFSGVSSVDADMPGNIPAGDTLVAHVVLDDAGTTVTTPTGWTQIGNVQDSISGDVRTYLYWRNTTSSEASTQTFSFSGSSSGAVTIVRYTGTYSAAPIHQSAQTNLPSLLDDFNRTDEDPLSQSGAWTRGVLVGEGAGANVRVVSNRGAADNSTSGASSYRTSFSAADALAMYTLAVKPGSGGWVGLYSRLQSPGAGAHNSYTFLIFDNGGADTWTLRREVGGAPTTLTTGSRAITVGEKYLLRVYGTTIEAWVQSGGTWSLITSTTDSNVTGVGSIGWSTSSVGSTTRIDDFSGTSFTSQTSPSITTTDSNTQIVSFFAIDKDSSAGEFYWSPPVGTREVADYEGGGFVRVGIFDAGQLTPGTVSHTATSGDNDEAAIFIIALTLTAPPLQVVRQRLVFRRRRNNSQIARIRRREPQIIRGPPGPTSNDKRQLEVVGQSTSSDTRQLEIVGKNTSNDTRSLQIVGSSPSGPRSSNRRQTPRTRYYAQRRRRDPIITRSFVVPKPTNDTRSLRVVGQSTSSDTRQLEVVGQSTSNATRSLQIVGADKKTSSRVVYTSTRRTRQLLVRRHHKARISRSFVTPAITSNIRQLEIVGQAASNDTRSLRIVGQNTSNDTRQLEIVGSLTSNDTRQLEVVGRNTSNDTRPLEVVGRDTSSDTRSLQVVGNAGSNDSRSLRITGQSSTNDTRSLRIVGRLTSSDERDLQIIGTNTSGDIRQLEVIGRSTSNDIRQLEIVGSLSANDIRALRIVGQSISSDIRQLEIIGSDTNNDSRSLRIFGLGSTSNTRSLRIVGDGAGPPIVVFPQFILVDGQPALRVNNQYYIRI